MCPDGRALARTVEHIAGEVSHLDGANKSTGKHTRSDNRRAQTICDDNGGLAGDYARPIERSTKTVNVRGVDKHEIPNVPLATVGATIPNTSRGPVVGIWHNYGCIGSGNSLILQAR